jgi:transcriptional regulator GlxA family with amidase domain
MGARPAASRRVSRLPPRLTAEQFTHAEALLRLILHDLEAALQAHLANANHAAAALRLRYLETENTRLRKELHRRIPDIPVQTAQPASGDHAHQIVAAMIDYVHAHYRHPMSLGEVAVHLKLTPNYLSALFSKAMGVTFHHYLEELRLAKAEELLRDPTLHVCEVAAAVGYASPSSFRGMFEKRVGHKPSTLRSRSAHVLL